MGKTEVMLCEDYVIGAGGHKKVYLDPRDSSRCIKILFDENDADWRREAQYREARARRGIVSQLLPEYYGEVATNLGTGYVFERIADYDGKTSRDLRHILMEIEKAPNYDLLEFGMSAFLRSMLAERIITTNVEYENFLVQMVTDVHGRVRIVDNIGTHSRFPLILYMDDFARSHIKRYFLRLLDDIARDFPKALPQKLFRHLVEYTRKV
ncbi:YrbL family protein [Anaerovibrio sp.]|uniref:YrbL family protein n=1 Tax=Anaerovibrio sp. TaxID=1872532 RepID=UPI003F142DFA